MLYNYTQIKQAFKLIPQFKQGQQKFKAFSNSVYSNYSGAKIFSPTNTPEHMVFERFLFLAILNKKYEKLKSGAKEAPQQFVKVIEKYKQQILKGCKQSDQSFNKFTQDLIRCVNFIEDANQLEHYNLVFYTVLIILHKQPLESFFGPKSIQYTVPQIKKLGRQFGQEICYMDYDNDTYNKKLVKQFEVPNNSSIYLLKAKKRVLIIYPSNRAMNIGMMKIIEHNQIPVGNVEQIFLKQKTYGVDQLRSSQNRSTLNKNGNNVSMNQNINNNANNIQNSPQSQSRLQQSQSMKSQVRDSRASIRKSVSQDSILLPLKVKCSKCQASIAQFDSLYWNYIYYCPSCLIDINVDTSDIPGPRINKFLKERNLISGDYDLQCPQCEHITKIRNYNPASKPKRYQCNLCTKIICANHKANIFSCFCYCNNCNKPTIYLQRLKINFCQFCRNRFCFKCKKKGTSFCGCVCKLCLGQDSKTHECEQACHTCNNKTTRLKDCNNCGLKICYGCHYRVLETYKQGMAFNCGLSEYV